jgi:hypothetical protein
MSGKCNIIGCEDFAEWQCPNCWQWYCDDHIENHDDDWEEDDD